MTKKQIFLLSLLLAPLSSSVTAGVGGHIARLALLTGASAGSGAYGFKKGRQVETLPELERPENPWAYVASTLATDLLDAGTLVVATAEKRLEELRKRLSPESSVTPPPVVSANPTNAVPSQSVDAETNSNGSANP